MSTLPPPREVHPVRSVLARILIVTGCVFALVVVILEFTSRAADGLAARRRADFDRAKRALLATDPQAKPADYAPGFFDKIAFATIDPAAQKLEDARTQAHPYLSYAMKPSWSTPPGAVPQVSHNSLGLRGKETTYAKPPGVYRIVTIGGSSVYGQSESCDEAVWSARLETYLNAKQTARKVEVINGGCSGWSSFEMLIDLELRMMDFEPDLVIVYEAINDMRCALYTAGGPEPQLDNTHWRTTWPVDRPSTLERWLEHSRSYLIWRRYLTNYVNERADLGFYAMKNYSPARNDLYCRWGDAEPPGHVPEQGFKNYQRNLENILTLCQSRAAKVLITTQALMRWYMVPPMECAETQIESFERMLQIERDVARARGVHLAETGKLIEVEEARVFKETGRHMFKNDVHPFDDGSDLIARTITDAVLESGLLN